jgi:hypothetical protein
MSPSLLPLRARAEMHVPNPLYIERNIYWLTESKDPIRVAVTPKRLVNA